MSTHRLNRRQMLQGMGLAATGAALAACCRRAGGAHGLR